ncbi:Hypothetical predicted protein [Xyrichtys novacula]|uniref:Uncharacterized protein n=1 Tax=Xyrichtys novacula TaxID=13765 RepID=A0AAV1G246_XYRNO|nr:Hypothetical predicted protein [Xyrichtys novacula]
MLTENLDTGERKSEPGGDGFMAGSSSSSSLSDQQRAGGSRELCLQIWRITKRDKTGRPEQSSSSSDSHSRLHTSDYSDRPQCNSPHISAHIMITLQEYLLVIHQEEIRVYLFFSMILLNCKVCNAHISVCVNIEAFVRKNVVTDTFTCEEIWK